MTRSALQPATLGAAALAVVLALGVTAADAHPRHGAETGHAMPRHDFAEFDADADGKITAEELEAHARARFDAADTDGNGSLSAAELTAQSEARRAEREKARIAERSTRMIERMDADRDGEIGFDEMTGATRRTMMERMLSHLDSDGDSAISPEEFAAAAEHRRFGHSGGSHEGKGHGGHRRGHGHHHH